jgi:hypothetical protein
MLGRRVAGGEEARRFDDDLDAELLPRQRRRLALGEDLVRRPVDGDLAVAVRDLSVEDPVGRVVLEHVREDVR